MQKWFYIYIPGGHFCLPSWFLPWSEQNPWIKQHGNVPSHMWLQHMAINAIAVIKKSKNENVKFDIKLHCMNTYPFLKFTKTMNISLILDSTVWT